jgi:hypothetical protein
LAHGSKHQGSIQGANIYADDDDDDDDDDAMLGANERDPSFPAPPTAATSADLDLFDSLFAIRQTKWFKFAVKVSPSFPPCVVKQRPVSPINLPLICALLRFPLGSSVLCLCLCSFCVRFVVLCVCFVLPLCSFCVRSIPVAGGFLVFVQIFAIDFKPMSSFVPVLVIPVLCVLVLQVAIACSFVYRYTCFRPHLVPVLT